VLRDAEEETQHGEQIESADPPALTLGGRGALTPPQHGCDGDGIGEGVGKGAEEESTPVVASQAVEAGAGALQARTTRVVPHIGDHRRELLPAEQGLAQVPGDAEGKQQEPRLQPGAEARPSARAEGEEGQLGRKRNDHDGELQAEEDQEADVMSPPAPAPLQVDHEEQSSKGEEKEQRRLELTRARPMQVHEVQCGEQGEACKETGAPIGHEAPQALGYQDRRDSEERREDPHGPSIAAEEGYEQRAGPVLQRGVHPGVVEAGLAA